VHLGTPGSVGERQMRFEEGPLFVREVALGYAFLKLGILPSERFSTPFQTVSWRSSENNPSTRLSE
jgi:hypothetical protein